MNDPIGWVYGLGFGATWVIMTRWYIKHASDLDDMGLGMGLGRVFVAGIFGFFGAVIWPLIWASLLMGIAVKKVTR